MSGWTEVTSLSRYAPISSKCRTSGCGQQVLDQFERGRVEPLQIVKEQSQGMFRAREHSRGNAKDQVETSLRVLGRQFRERLAAPR